jgi:membrane protein
MVAIIDALNRAYDVTEWRPWWRRRLLAIVLTLALAVFILVSLTLVLIGPDIAFWLAGWLGLNAVVPWAWSLMRWPLIVSFVILGINLVYHFAPNRRRGRWMWLTPGSVVATALWIAASVAFKFYVKGFADYAATYGAIAGAIITMLWFYVSGLAMLTGAELNGVLEQVLREHDSGARQ